MSSYLKTVIKTLIMKLEMMKDILIYMIYPKIQRNLWQQKVEQLKLFKTYTKDEQRLVWIVYRGKVKKTDFIENSEVSEVIFIKNIKDISPNELRGELTEQLLDDLNV